MKNCACPTKLWKPGYFGEYSTCQLESTCFNRTVCCEVAVSPVSLHSAILGRDCLLFRELLSEKEKDPVPENTIGSMNGNLSQLYITLTMVLYWWPLTKVYFPEIPMVPIMLEIEISLDRFGTAQWHNPTLRKPCENVMLSKDNPVTPEVRNVFPYIAVHHELIHQTDTIWGNVV